MSDTPRTDAEKIAAGFQAVPENFLRFARKLERENAELKAYADKLADGLPCLPKDVENLRTANAEFAAENAALRAIVDDAFKLIEHANPNAWANGNTHPDGFGPDEGEVMASRYYNSLLDARAAIDAARKEGTP